MTGHKLSLADEAVITALTAKQAELETEIEYLHNELASMRIDSYMNMANHRAEVEKLLNEWADNPKEGGNLFNCLIEFLTDDVHYLKDNIRQSDRRRLIELANRLTPNAKVNGLAPAQEINHE